MSRQYRNLSKLYLKEVEQWHRKTGEVFRLKTTIPGRKSLSPTTSRVIDASSI